MPSATPSGTPGKVVVTVAPQQQIAARVVRGKSGKTFGLEALQRARQRQRHPSQGLRRVQIGPQLAQAGKAAVDSSGLLGKGITFRPDADHRHALFADGDGLDQHAAELAAARRRCRSATGRWATSGQCAARHRPRRVERIGQCHANRQRQPRPARPAPAARPARRSATAPAAECQTRPSRPRPPCLLLGDQQAGRVSSGAGRAASLRCAGCGRLSSWPGVVTGPLRRPLRQACSGEQPRVGGIGAARAISTLKPGSSGVELAATALRRPSAGVGCRTSACALGPALNAAWAPARCRGTARCRSGRGIPSSASGSAARR